MPHPRGSPGSGGRGRGGAGGYRKHPYSEHSRGRGGARGRGRGSGRGAREPREDRRRYHEDRPNDDYIPLSGRTRGVSKFRGMTKPFPGNEHRQSDQSSGNYSRRGRWTGTPQKHVQSNPRSGQLPKRPLSGRQKDKKFVKAARAGSHSEDDSGDVVAGYNYENDEGIDSDEADQSEEEYLMQGFDWSEADQDPDQKSKAQSRTVQREPETESCISMSGWGGALVYQRPDERKTAS